MNQTRLLFRKLLSSIERRQKSDVVRIGCASGFWGDTIVSTPQLVSSKEPEIDFITYDYLSEITMSLLARAKAKNSQMGYCPDFVHAHMKPNLLAIKKKGIKVVSNAGGLNPLSCVDALHEVCKQQNVNLRVAAVVGDDLLNDELNKQEAKSILTQYKPEGTLTSVNAYFGANGIKLALDEGADIVVTGRVVDSAMTLAPLMHRFDWSFDDVDKLALGSLGGHLIECGAQATGGIATDWRQMSNWETIGFPIVEFDRSANSFLLTKPQGTGGQVNIGTITEQLLYEIDDPECYRLPDVFCDFSRTTIKQKAADVVEVDNVYGVPPGDELKVTATYAQGYRCTVAATIVGGDTVAKARKTGEAIIARCRFIFKRLGLNDFTRVHMHPIGSDESFAPSVRLQMNPRECVMWIAVEHENKQALEYFAREIAPAGTGMAPGLCGIAGGRPSVSPVLKHFSFGIHRQLLKTRVIIDGTTRDYNFNHINHKTTKRPIQQSENVIKQKRSIDTTKTVRLEELAYTRSGDKGDTCNIGVIARNPANYDHLCQVLTEERVRDYFAHLITEGGAVTRYLLPGSYSMNFVLTHSLGGGGIASLRIDPQGKAYGQMLVDLMVPAL